MLNVRHEPIRELQTFQSKKYEIVLGPETIFRHQNIVEKYSKLAILASFNINTMKLSDQ